MSRGGMRCLDERFRGREAPHEATEDLGAGPVPQATGTMLASLSHEIRTPLTALLGSAQLLLRDPDLSGSQRAQLELIHRSGAHLCEVLSEMLEMSRIQSGRGCLRPVPFDLALMLEDAAAMGRAGAEARGVGFEVNLGRDVPRYAITDACKLQQVLANVLGNAVKFTRRGRVTLRVDATLERPGLYTLHVEVEDTGVGIAEGEMAGLFQPYVQSASGRASSAGTGLGLALSRDYVRLLGGELHLTSQVGRGTVLRFSIPLRPARHVDVDRVGARTSACHLRAGQEDFRVLVVHADVQTRVLLSDTLRRAGFRTREAATEDEAATWLEEWEPHVVFVDAGGGRLGGLDALRRGAPGRAGKRGAVVGIMALPLAPRGAAPGGMVPDLFIHLPLRESEIFESLAEALGVEYDARELGPGVAGRAARRPHPIALTRSDLACLDQGLVERMRQATALLDFELLLDLVQEVEGHSPVLAAGLRALVARYAYDDLTELLQAAQVDGDG